MNIEELKKLIKNGSVNVQGRDVILVKTANLVIDRAVKITEERMRLDEKELKNLLEPFCQELYDRGCRKEGYYIGVASGKLSGAIIEHQNKEV